MDFTVRSDVFAAIAAVRIRSGQRLAAPVVIYEATVDGAQTATFTKRLEASVPGALDQLHQVVCSGEAMFEILGAKGETLAQAPVIPSNTGKC